MIYHIIKIMVGYTQWKSTTCSLLSILIFPANRTIFSDPQYAAGFKRWTQFVSLYGLNNKQRLNTRQTVGCGIPSSLLALPVDLGGLRSKLSSVRLTFSSDTRGRPEHLPLHRQPICWNWWFQRQTLFLIGGWMLKRRRNACCTQSPTQF